MVHHPSTGILYLLPWLRRRWKKPGDLVRDRDVQLVCDRPSIEMILINQFDNEYHDFLPDYLELDHLKTNSKFVDSPVLVITGHIFSKRKKNRLQSSGIYSNKMLEILHEYDI